MSDEEQKKELETLGTTRMLGKITTIGYSSLHLMHYCVFPFSQRLHPANITRDSDTCGADGHLTS